MSNTAQRKPGEANPIVQLAILAGILVLVLNAGFYFISEAYFADQVKKLGAEEVARRLFGARRDFAIFTIVVAGAWVLTAMHPRTVAHGIAVLAGLASLVAAPFAFGISVVLPVTLMLVAGIFGLLVWHSLRRSRAAWSCLAALCAVYGVVMLFGAPKIRGLLDVGMWIAMIAPGLLAVATGGLSLIRADYREPA